MMVSASIERELASRLFPVRTGVFVAVTGPSGSGKDTLIAYARERLGPGDDVLFARRVITRTANPAAEDHDVMDAVAFAAAEAAGALALSWQANGLSYGLPLGTDDAMRDGRVVVANLSRAAVADLRARYANCMVVSISAPADILASRLAARGRENEAEIRARLERGARRLAVDDRAVTIDNDGTIEMAGEHFLAIVRKAIAYAAVSETV